MSEPALRVSNVGVSFDLWTTQRRTLRRTVAQLLREPRELKKGEKFWALREVTFELDAGDVLGVIGQNGSGKSTLSLVIAGVLRPDTGAVETFGRAPTLLSLGAGFEEDLTGRENIYLNGAFLGFSRRTVAQYMAQIIDFSDLGDFIDVPLRKYSTGMKTRLAFSIAAHIEPELLLLDEVLGVGDAAFQSKSREKIDELMSKAKSIVVVTHDMEFVKEACTKALWLDRARIAAFGDPEETVAAYLAEVETSGVHFETTTQEAAVG